MATAEVATEAVATLEGGKAPGANNLSVELLKAGSEAMDCGLHAVRS